MHIPKSAPQPRWKLLEARTLHKWSQREVADRIGTSVVNVNRWERGTTKPGPYFRRKLCILFGKTEQELDLEATPEETAPPGPLPVDVSHKPLYDPAIPLLPAIPLVGRDNELARIKQRLYAGGNVALTAFHGLPGVGKTALSIALAHDPAIRKHFRDGVLWAGLGPQPNVEGLLSHWGTLLDIPATEMATLNSNEAWGKALHSAIASRAMLLIIDDVWKVEDALIFKVGGPNCAHLVTTRFPKIAAHIAVGGTTAIKELGENESMALLSLLAPEAVEREMKKAHDLVHAVGGLPLALTLMGNYLRKEATGGQPRQINEALKRLSDVEERLQISEALGSVESHSSLSPDTPLSLQSVIAVSDQQLSEQAHKALCALSVFPPKPNSFSEEAALAVANCTTGILDTLIGASLLESSSPGRYTLHQTIADYARVHLKEKDAYDRLIAYVISFIEAHKKDYKLLELESHIILAALESAYNLDRRTELVQGTIAFAPFLLSRGLYPLAEQHLQRAHEAAIALENHYGMASILLYLGEIAQNQGNFVQAEAYYQEGLTLARQIRDDERISALLTNLGWVAWKQGKYAKAETYLYDGLTIARQRNDTERTSGLLKVLGSVAANLGNYTQSEAYLQEGLVLAHKIGDNEQACLLLINLGATAGEQGNHIRAEEYFQEGLVLARQIGHSEWISALLTNLGEAAAEQGHYMQAEAYLQEGLQLAQQIEHSEWTSVLLINLGLVARKQENYPQAEVYLQKGLALARQIGIPQITANALYEHGNLYFNKQQVEIAEASFREMLAIISEESQDLFALSHYGLARVAAVQGNLHEARKFGLLSVTALEAIGHRNAGEVRNWLNTIMG